MNLGDPELELVDPTPNVHSLFLHFDKLFFWAKLSSRAVVRWSKRMYSCAGICSYDRGGLCDIALSEPLLKLRSRKDLVETLLHEMIHAFLFITNRDRDRDGHGPNFKAHMHRINQATGLNISIYHDFHDEVKLYQTHWWRCNGPCQSRKPHFGIVRRSMNRAPGPSDYWWDDHKRKCGGTFVKIKEPEKQENKKQVKKRASPKPSGDITKYINTNNTGKNISKPILKESNNVPVKSNLVKNSSNTVVISKKNNIVFNPQVTKTPDVFSGKGKTLNNRNSTGSSDVAETVRNVWANRTLPTIFPNSSSNNKNQVPRINDTNSPNSNKHKADTSLIRSPPLKIKKIDDYFKTIASSVLKDLYGQDFEIKEVNNKNKRLSVVAVSSDLVDCPVCISKISSSEINRHLDECLNKDVIESISKKTKPVIVIDNDGVHEIKDKPPKVNGGPLDIINVDLNANIKTEPYFKNPNKEKIDNTDFKFPAENEIHIKIEPGTSKELKGEQKCSCCDKVVDNLDQHLDECLAFFDNNTTIPTEGASTSFSTSTIVIDDDDDDIFDESLTLNATGTKSPCPCCLKMIEQVEMNDHLDICLNQ
ncbi:unnamed protein product, partial [Brenthis ino]